MNKKQVVLVAVLCLGSFIAGAAMRPMRKPSVIFNRPFEPSSAPVVPGPLVHVCLCGQKIACNSDTSLARKLNEIEVELISSGILVKKEHK